MASLDRDFVRKGGYLTAGTISSNLGDSRAPDATSAAAERGRSTRFVAKNSGESLWILGARFTYLVTGAESGGSYFTLLVDMGPEQGPPPHIHHCEEEQFYVLDGEATYWVGDQVFHASQGDFVHIPRNTVHWFKTGLKPARLLATFAPAGIEGFFREVGDPADDRSDTPPPVTSSTIARLLDAEAARWSEHHHTLPPSPPEAQ